LGSEETLEVEPGSAIRVGALGDPPEEVTLRPITAADEPFLRRVYASTRSTELEPVRWKDKERRAFCDSQFDLQDAHYHRGFPAARFDVVEWGSRPAGRLLVAPGGTEWVILDIAMAPEACGGGLGTLLLQWVQGMAAVAGSPLMLAVEQGNPARSLFRRLGFQLRTEGEFLDEMVWRAHAIGSEAVQRFCDVALADDDLRASLASAEDDLVLASRAVSLGLPRGLAFGADDVLETLRSRRRTWIERAIA
jgi:GNAT superfamily N-acetyltransferase